MALCRVNQFDAALVDLSLPDAGSLDTVEALSSSFPQVPIVVQTGMEDDDLANEALTSGAQDFLSKSEITATSLARAINHAITRHSLRSTRVALRESHSDLDDLTRMVAHDLRAPVRTARLLADRLTAQVAPDDERAADFGARLDQVLRRLDTLVIGMLDYSGLRLEEVELESVNLALAVAEAIDDIEADGERVGLRVSVDVADDLCVMANPSLFSRVLVNALTNSIKFRRDDLPLRIEVAAVAVGQTVIVRIADNGIGLPDGTHEKVFELTRRLNHKHEGLGLGLAIGRRCMELMHGSVVFDPSVTQGATMEITIPLAHCERASTVSNALFSDRGIGFWAQRE